MSMSMEQAYKVDFEQANEIMAEQQQEIERLNNIINELEKYIKELPNNEYIGYWKKEILEDIEELKQHKNTTATQKEKIESETI